LVADKSVGSRGSLSLLFRDEGDDFILCEQFSQGYNSLKVLMWRILGNLIAMLL
jgi:hypothetical protein